MSLIALKPEKSQANWNELVTPLLCTSLLFTAIYKASPDSHFAFLHFFFHGDGLDPFLFHGDGLEGIRGQTH